MSFGRIPLVTRRVAGRSTGRRINLVLATATTLLIGSGLLTVWTGRPQDRSADAALSVPPTVVSATDRSIAALQARIQERPDAPARFYYQLGAAYLQKSRESADPAYYPRAEAALTKALAIAPDDFEAMIALGELALARHQFREAITWADRARAINPHRAAIYGVIGDAHIELGDYSAAAAAFQEMLDRRPDAASYARASYLRELHGDIEGAGAAMRLAVDNAGNTGENAAWYRVQLGHLAFNYQAGRPGAGLDAADGHYQDALAADPGNVYALAGLARTRAARGDHAGAIALYSSLAEVIPLPAIVIALGDVYTAAGRPDDAARQYDLVAVIDQLYRANGVETDLDLALFNADHRRNLPGALDRARRQWIASPSIKSADVLAWTLYQSGDYPAAQAALEQAQRLGTRDALLSFHAGMIAHALGDEDAARRHLTEALSLNPSFSPIHAATARQALGESKVQSPKSKVE